MSIPPPPDYTIPERIEWSKTERKILKALIAVVIIVVVILLVALPVFDHTRDARYEVVSMTQEYWVTRDARYDASFSQDIRSGFWCAYYVLGILNLTEVEGTGGTFQIHFANSPEGNTQDTSVYLSSNQRQTITSQELCADTTESTVSYSVTPPRINEAFRGIVGNNPVWELHGKLTLRELEGIGGEYVVRLDLTPGPAESHSHTVNIYPNSVNDFDATFSVPSGTGYTIRYSINAPKVQEKAALIKILLGWSMRS